MEKPKYRRVLLKLSGEALDRALDAAECIISRGVTEAQNRFN